MNEHLKKSEAELNELLAEYWKLRRETGEYICVLLFSAVQAGILHRCVYGDAGKQAEHACYIRMTHVFSSHVSYQCNLSLPSFCTCVSPPCFTQMSEFDSLSDSEWLDVSSRDSDDVSISSQESNHEEISSIPHSRRSSISVASSMNSEVEAWEGFVSDNGDEVAPDAHPEAVIGMYPVPLPSALEPEPITAGFIPDVDQLSAAPPQVVDEEDRRVKDALDQSFIGTLSASRSSTTGGHFASTHTSINDLRLSFPDPLTSSHNNELNASYQAVSSSETSDSQRSDNDDAHELTIASTLSLSSAEDPGLTATTPEVRCHGDYQQRFIESDEKSQLEIVLYGASSEIKWHFIQELVQKAAGNAGRVLVDPLHSGAESDQVQTIRLYKDSDAFQAPFFSAVTVHDRTGDTLPPKFELVRIKH
jgi:hypothetical protein